VLPYSQFVPFLRENGLDARAFLAQLFATHTGAFFGWGVIVSSVVLWVMVSVEGRRAGLGHRWVPIVANLAVGVSLARPSGWCTGVPMHTIRNRCHIIRILRSCSDDTAA
jgi:hypothetical protein